MKISLMIICIAVLASSVRCQKESATRVSPEKEAAETEAESVAFYPFWPASKKEHRVFKRKVVGSRYGALDGRGLLRFETELVTASFNILDVIEQFERHFKEYPNLKCDKILAEKLREESEARSQFGYSEFSREERERLRYCIADLLEQGKFVIRLRSNGQIVSRITACEWSNVRGPLDGIGGRVFYLEDERVFFWTAEWIS